MANIRRFHPGMYIKETLEAMEMTARDFSAGTGISERTLSAIINGNGDITFNIAYKLSLYFDNSANYWTNLQNQYNLYKFCKNNLCRHISGVFLLSWVYPNQTMQYGI